MSKSKWNIPWLLFCSELKWTSGSADTEISLKAVLSAWGISHVKQRQSIDEPVLTASRYSDCDTPVKQVRCCQRRQPSHWRPSWRGRTDCLQEIHIVRKIEDIGTGLIHLLELLNKLIWVSTTEWSPLYTSPGSRFWLQTKHAIWLEESLI